MTSETEGTPRKAVCTVCGALPALVELAEARLAETGRQLTPQERERYLGRAPSRTGRSSSHGRLDLS